MRLVNRAAITVTPKQPYIDWANLCRLLTSFGPDSSLKQPIGSHDANRPGSECGGVEIAMERPPVEDWMGSESAR